MFQQHSNTFTPIRSTVGKAVLIRMEVQHTSIAVQQQGLNPVIKNRTSIIEAATDEELLKFWPKIRNEAQIGGEITYSADPHQPFLIVPDPVRPPFPKDWPHNTEDAPYNSIFALATKNSEDDTLSRELSITFRISLLGETHLIGGIAFSGYPVLSYTIDKFGRTSSNYGLPREMRISIASLESSGTHESKFIDADLHYTKQVINHSSGFHYFHVEPTLTDSFTLQFSDFPLLMKRVLLGSGGSIKYTQAFGLVIPYLYVYTYQEKSHYHHYVPGGVVGAVKSDDSVATRGLLQEHLSPEWQRLITQSGTGKSIYQLFPASSIFRSGRRYHDNSPTYDYRASEQFVSDPIKKGESISLICRQCDETIRSIAGIELKIPVFDPKTSTGTEGEIEQQIGLPEKEVNLLDKVGIKIYELDFPTGVSPLDAQKKELRKYKHLLAEKTITKDDTLSLQSSSGPPAQPDQRSIRFKRASNQQYFEIELINLGDQPGNAVVHSAMFIQSAHITLHPKLSRRLQVSRMHFRIVGSDLVEDYSQIGTHGFNFSIERLSGGQPIQQIIAIRSLSDLMQSGMAKIMSNSRRRAVEFEKSNVYHHKYNHPGKDTGIPAPPYQNAFPDEVNDNYQFGESLDRNQYWHKVQSGKENYPVDHEISDQDFADSTVSQRIKNDSEILNSYQDLLVDINIGKYETYATTESGTHNKHMFPDEDWRSVKGYFQLVESIAELRVGDQIIPTVPEQLLTQFSAKFWNGLKKENLSVNGLRNFSLSPGSYFETEYIQDLIDLITGQNADIDLIREFVSRISPPSAIAQLALFGGISGGISGTVNLSPFGVGGSTGVSIGTQSPFPGMNYSTTYGSQGTITQQAQKTAYSYSKTLNEQARASANISSTLAGENKRIIERRAVPNSDQKRIKGAEIMWQGELKDIILGTVPLDISFPALAERDAVSFDEALQVRFGNGIGDDIEVDFWFEIKESEIRDDF